MTSTADERLGDEALESLLEGAINDCPCILAKDSREMCQQGRCYHRTGEGVCVECAGGYGLTVTALIRIGYEAALKQMEK